MPFFPFKFLQVIAISSVHKQDPGQRHCVGRLCHSQRSKWLSSYYDAPNISRLHSCIYLHLTDVWVRHISKNSLHCTKFEYKNCIISYCTIYFISLLTSIHYFCLFTDSFDDKYPRVGLQWGVFWRWEAVQTWALAAGEQHHQPFCPCSLRHRKEDVHRSAAGRAAAAAGHVLGKISSVHTLFKLWLSDIDL